MEVHPDDHRAVWNVEHDVDLQEDVDVRGVPHQRFSEGKRIPKRCVGLDGTLTPRELKAERLS